MRQFYFILFSMTLLLCSCGQNSATLVANNTFIYKDKIYKVVGNDLTELADLDSKHIKKLDSLKPKEVSLGEQSLSYIKKGANAKLDALYRGDILYFRLTILGFSDLKKNYNPGKFTLELLDEYGFILNSVEIATSDLTGVVGNDSQVEYYVYSGKLEMNSDIFSAIKTYSLPSALTHK